MGSAVIPILMGAGVGAAASAITGGDPLKGALLGGLTGGIAGPVGGLLGGAEAGPTAGLLGGAEAGTTAGLLGGGARMGAAILPEVESGAALAARNFRMPNPSTAALFGPEATAASQTAKILPQTTTSTVPKQSFSGIWSAVEGEPAGFGQRLGNYLVQNPELSAAGISGLANMMFNKPQQQYRPEPYTGVLTKYKFDPLQYRPTYGFADGGLADSRIATPQNTDLFAQTPLRQPNYIGPIQMQSGAGVINPPPTADQGIGAIPIRQGFKAGGRLGGYSDGGSLLRGPGDGMSDSIPARIGAKQPARLADGEFVVPADVVSNLGNGSTDAGAKQLYAMMDRVRMASTGTKKQAKEIKACKILPA